MAGALEALLLLVNLLASATLGYIALRLYRLASILESPRDPVVAFTSMALGHLAAGASLVAPDREAFTLYVASASLTAAGLLSLEASRLRGFHAIAAPVAVLPAAADAAAIAAGLGGVALFRGPARLASALYALGHAARLASLPLIPSQASALLLVIGEVSRAAAAASLALAYSPMPPPRVSRRWHGGEAG